MSLVSFLHLTSVVPIKDTNTEDRRNWLKNIVLTVGIGSFAIIFVMLFYLKIYCKSHRQAKPGSKPHEKLTLAAIFKNRKQS